MMCIFHLKGAVTGHLQEIFAFKTVGKIKNSVFSISERLMPEALTEFGKSSAHKLSKEAKTMPVFQVI